MRHHMTVDGPVPFTLEEETARDAEEAQAATERADYEANHKYKDDRKAEYGTVEDQLDMIYWDQVNGTTTFKDHIFSIKDKHKKPEKV